MIDFEKMQAKIDSQGEMISAMYKLLFSEKQGPSVQDDKPMNVTEASEFLGVPIQTLYTRKAIPRHKQGKRVYFFRSELRKYVTG